MNAAEIAGILNLHLKWLWADPAGKRADLRGANLRRANLGVVNLRDANLSDADLRRASLRGANLRDANLGGANLRGADLSSADLGRASLRGANLRDANLGGANLRGADLGRASLRDANLRDANLGGADLSDADLGDQRIIQIAPIGSRGDYLIYRFGVDHTGVPMDEVRTGCFRGTLGDFTRAVEQTHGNNAYGRAYRAAIMFVEALRAEAPVSELGSELIVAAV